MPRVGRGLASSYKPNGIFASCVAHAGVPSLLPIEADQCHRGHGFLRAATVERQARDADRMEVSDLDVPDSDLVPWTLR